MLEIFDLTHRYENGYTISWPTASQYDFQKGFWGLTDSGFYYEANDFKQAEHSGTHTDAPAHFAQGKWRMGQIPIERLIGPGIVIDITKKTK